MRRLTLPPAAYKLLCYRVFTRDKWKCRICGQFRPLHSHHIQYRSRGGPDTSWNLLSLCEPCHSAIHTHQKVLLLPTAEGQRVDADHVVKIIFINGFIPGRNT